MHTKKGESSEKNEFSKWPRAEAGGFCHMPKSLPQLTGQQWSLWWPKWHWLAAWPSPLCQNPLTRKTPATCPPCHRKSNLLTGVCSAHKTQEHCLHLHRHIALLFLCGKSSILHIFGGISDNLRHAYCAYHKTYLQASKLKGVWIFMSRQAQEKF